MTLSERISSAVEAVRKVCPVRPKIGLILGSGLGNISLEAKDTRCISFSDIPHFRDTSVAGHRGRIAIGTLADVPVVILEGRIHAYEGYSMADVVFPVRTLIGLGIDTLVLTNAAGAVNPTYRAGDIMLIEDHLNLMGDSPLKGPNLSEIEKLGPRFLDQSQVYDPNARTLLLSEAKKLGIPLHSGVYASVLGPTYETPAEVKMLRVLGADAVGMSTVPEAITAHHQAINLLGISLISNMAAGLSTHQLSHTEVLENAKKSASAIQKLLLSSMGGLAQMKGGKVK